MTLIIGVNCKDGIVIGADSAASFRATNEQNLVGELSITQPVSKINILEKKLLIATSGSVGLGARISDELHNLYRRNSSFNGLSLNVTLERLREGVWKVFKREREISNEAIEQIKKGINTSSSPELQKKLTTLGNSIYMYGFVETLIAFTISGEPKLFQYDGGTGLPEAIEKYTYTCIGNGQQFAFPLLSLLQKVFWPKEKPAIGEAIFAVVWTLQLAVKKSANKYNDPLQICVLQKIDSSWKARELPSTELEEMIDFVNQAELHLTEFKNKLRPE